MILEPPVSVQKLQTALQAKAKEAPGYRFYLLYDKVYRKDVLEYAYRCCRANRGAPGVDDQDFEDIEAYGEVAGQVTFYNLRVTGIDQAVHRAHRRIGTEIRAVGMLLGRHVDFEDRCHHRNCRHHHHPIGYARNTERAQLLAVRCTFRCMRLLDLPSIQAEILCGSTPFDKHRCKRIVAQSDWQGPKSCDSPLVAGGFDGWPNTVTGAEIYGPRPLSLGH